MGTLPLGGLLRLPPRPFLDTLILRVLVIWLFLHGASFAGSSSSGLPYPESLVGNPMGTLFMIAVIIFVVRVEMWRKSEILFLANLGYSFQRIALLAVGECLLLEVGLRVAFVVA